MSDEATQPCLRTPVTRDDGVVALEGTALCYTVTPKAG